MRGDRSTAAAGRVDDYLQFFLRESRRCLIVIAPSIVGVNLYPICAVSNLIANDANQVLTVSFFAALRDSPFGRIAFRTIAARCDDRPRDDDHSRTGNNALLNGLFQTYV